VNDSPGVVEGAFVVGNLIGIPSYHFDPTFARVAANAVTTFRPSVVALELPDGLMGELEWAASCWPGAVVSASERAFFPFVPGDSIFETFRLARAARIPIALVDLPSADGAPKPTTRQERAIHMGCELARAGAGLFLEANDSLVANLGPPDRRDVAREAYMAQSLARLLAQGETVMWVGGMAHWTRIVARITSGNINDAGAEVTIHSDFKRMRLAPSALYRMTRRCLGLSPTTDETRVLTENTLRCSSFVWRQRRDPTDGPPCWFSRNDPTIHSD
jgi:hypothetical protein